MKFLKCSRCKAASYCGKSCQIANYKGNGKSATQPRSHKEVCPELVEMNAEFENHPTAGPTFLRTVLFQSWANQHCVDGSFFMSEFLARKSVLGGANVGFWAQPEPIAGPFLAPGGVDLRPGSEATKRGVKRFTKCCVCKFHLSLRISAWLRYDTMKKSIFRVLLTTSTRRIRNGRHLPCQHSKASSILSTALLTETLLPWAFRISETDTLCKSTIQPKHISTDDLPCLFYKNKVYRGIFYRMTQASSFLPVRNAKIGRRHCLAACCACINRFSNVEL
jgi:MYND finger